MLRLALAFVFMLAWCSTIFWGAIFVTRAYGFDQGQWQNIDPSTREWFRSLKNSRGESCCDFADGVRLEDPAWKENEDHSFEVFARDKWTQVPPERVLKGTNRVGFAILWWPKGTDKPICFLPGSNG